MNKRMKLLFFALSIVIIVLTAAITRFYSASEQNNPTGSTQNVITRKIDHDDSGNQVFQDSSGLFGIADSSDRVMVSPEWEKLTLIGSGKFIAEKKIGGKNLTGCINHEGNIIVPFIYRNIQQYSINNFVFYIANVENDENFIIYDSDFSPCLRNSWISCEVTDDKLILGTQKGSYTFIVNQNGFALKNASLCGKASFSDYKIEITSKLLLSKLTVPMLEKMAEDAESYLEFAFSENENALNDIHSSDNTVFYPIFPNESKIVSKRMMKIADIFLYSVRSEDGIPHYAVSVTTDTIITYHDDKNNLQTMRDNYKAVIEFKGNSAIDLEAVSGSFNLQVPNYPEPEHPSISESDNENNDSTA